MVRPKRYHIHSGSPNRKGVEDPQFQKSKDKRNSPMNKRYQTRVFFFSSQNGRSFKR